MLQLDCFAYLGRSFWGDIACMPTQIALWGLGFWVTKWFAHLCVGSPQATNGSYSATAALVIPHIYVIPRLYPADGLRVILSSSRRVSQCLDLPTCFTNALWFVIKKKTTTMACVLLQSWGHVICYSPQDSYLQRAGPTQCNFPCFAEVTNTCNISVKLLDDFFPKMIMLEPPSGVLLSKNEWRLLNPGSCQSCYWMLNQLSFSFTVGALIHSCHQINIL